jgi:N-acetylmuramoyl-L-alanine amidase
LGRSKQDSLAMIAISSRLLSKISISAALGLLVLAGIHATVAIACEPSAFVVAVDIGHTRMAPGATSARGVPEFEFNRVLANEVVSALKADGFTGAFLINGDGRIGSLAERTRLALSGDADLFLSIHHDSVQPHYLETWTVNGRRARYSDRFSGYSLFVSANNRQFDRSLRAAVEIGKAFRARGLEPALHHAEPIRGENRPLLDPRLGIYRFDDLLVLERTSMPAVLVEAGIIVNRDEERALAEPARQRLIAVGIAAAIRTFCRRIDAPEEENGASPPP